MLKFSCMCDVIKNFFILKFLKYIINKFPYKIVKNNKIDITVLRQKAIKKIEDSIETKIFCNCDKEIHVSNAAFFKKFDYFMVENVTKKSGFDMLKRYIFDGNYDYQLIELDKEGLLD